MSPPAEPDNLPANTPADEPLPLPDGPPAPGTQDLLCAGEVRILVIDDNASVCQVIDAALAYKDFAITSVSEPLNLEGVIKGETKYHLIILDYTLPPLSTDQVLAWLRDYQADAALIVITGHPTTEGAVNALRARAADYLMKPFEITQLRETVYRCLKEIGLLRMSEKSLRENLGNALRDRRKALSLTLADVAKRSNVSLGYLSQIELGKSSASVETLYRVCLTLRLRMADLFQAIQKS
jgi:FixJ family two-component response regulator